MALSAPDTSIRLFAAASGADGPQPTLPDPGQPEMTSTPRKRAAKKVAQSKETSK